MRERLKCPECGLVQWNDGACKRCGFSPDEATPGDAAATAPPESPEAGSAPSGDTAGFSEADFSADGGSAPFGDPGAFTTTPEEPAAKPLWQQPFLAAVALVGLAVIAFVVFSPEEAAVPSSQGEEVVLSSPLSLAALEEHCPATTGTFLCQIVEGEPSRLVATAAGEAVEAVLEPGSLRVEAAETDLVFRMQGASVFC